MHLAAYGCQARAFLLQGVAGRGVCRLYHLFSLRFFTRQVREEVYATEATKVAIFAIEDSVGNILDHALSCGSPFMGSNFDSAAVSLCYN